MLENVLAAGKVTGATGASSTLFGAVPARTGAGVYTITMDQQVDSAFCCAIATLVGGDGGRITITHTSDAVKTVNTFNAAGAAADVDFHIRIAALNGG